MLLRTFWKVFWPLKFGAIITWIATITSIASPFLSNEWLSKIIPWLQSNKEIIILIVVAIISARYLYLLNNEIKKLEIQLHDKNIWGEAIKSLKEAYSHIHFMRKDEIISDETFMNGMIDFCDTLHDFYNGKTKAKCCISIKVPIKKVELDDESQLSTLSFVNLCRDSHHPMRDNPKYKSTIHTVIGNSAYNAVINNILKDYRNNPTGKKTIGYVNNNIPEDNHYKTTSPYDENNIPYKSELVFPLIPIKASESKKYVLVGFICIDCDDIDKFKNIQEYEAPMIEGVADGLYDIIYKRNEQKQWITK